MCASEKSVKSGKRLIKRRFYISPHNIGADNPQYRSNYWALLQSLQKPAFRRKLRAQQDERLSRPGTELVSVEWWLMPAAMRRPKHTDLRAYALTAGAADTGDRDGNSEP